MYFNVHGLPVATDILHILTCTYRLNQCCTVTVAKEKEKILTYVERFTHLEGRKRRGAGMALPKVRFIT